MKRVAVLLLAMAMLLISAVSVGAVDYGCDVDTDSGAVYLENLDTGAVVFEKNAAEQMYPASTTKIMTYVVVAEHVSDFDGTMVEIKESVLSGLDPESTVMGLSDHIGEQVSIRDLLYGMMLPSGNDAALVMADYVGGSVSGFVELMNAKAQELGCTGTHFANPHGLYDPDHYTTARDLALIAKYAETLPDFKEITAAVSYTPAGFDTLHNTNYMLDSDAEGGAYYYPYVKGIKTGYTDEAGKCLVTVAEKDGLNYLCVCLGAPYSFAEDVNYAMLDTKDLYEWAFNALNLQTVYGPQDIVKTVNVNYVWGDRTTDLVPEREVIALLPNNFDQSLVVVDIDCADSVEAPVSKGDIVGTVHVRYDDTDLGVTNVIATEDIERDGLNYALVKTGDFIKNHIILMVILAVLLFILILFLSTMRAARRRRAARARARSGRRYR